MSNSLNIRVKKVHEDAVIPSKKNGDLGFDLHVIRDCMWDYNVEKEKHYYHLLPYEQKLFSTGLKIALPKGYGALYRDRSGLASKYGLVVGAGVIDNGFRNEWKILLRNTSNEEYEILEGDRICQAIIVEEYELGFMEVDELDTTDRGKKGFGSSGK